MTLKDSSSPNQTIVDILREIAGYYNIENDVHREKTYRLASNAIEVFEKVIKSSSDIKNVKGIGKSVSADVDQILANGTCDRLETLKLTHAPSFSRDAVIDLFMKVHGIGRVKANQLFAEGYRTIDDLKRDIQKFTKAQRIGITYFDDIQKKIPRNEMDIINAALNVHLCGYVWCIAGSYRRGEDVSGDIDVLIQEADMQAVVAHLKDQGAIKETLSSGRVKFMGLLQVSHQYPFRRIDIQVVSREEWPFALLYFTGSKAFNVLIRQRALETSLTLNEHRLASLDGSEVYEAETEEDIFELLGVRHIPPNLRLRHMTELELI